MNLELEARGGTIVVPEAVLLQIAARAAESVEGVRVRRRRAIDLKANTVRLGLAASGGEPLVVLGESVQTAVVDTMETMCGLTLAVDVAFEERT
jgi:uncharacterized alkaline shock family protein YloU